MQYLNSFRHQHKKPLYILKLKHECSHQDNCLRTKDMNVSDEVATDLSVIHVVCNQCFVNLKKFTFPLLKTYYLPWKCTCLKWNYIACSYESWCTRFIKAREKSSTAIPLMYFIYPLKEFKLLNVYYCISVSRSNSQQNINYIQDKQSLTLNFNKGDSYLMIYLKQLGTAS